VLRHRWARPLGSPELVAGSDPSRPYLEMFLERLRAERAVEDAVAAELAREEAERAAREARFQRMLAVEREHWDGLYASAHGLAP
jgi:hypothetical protein